MKKGNGFTLIEVLVAVFIFSLVIGGAVNLLVSTISQQKISLLNQQILREQSSLAEYMGRALRQAVKDLTGNCIAAGNNYGLISGATGIRFLNRDNVCQQFFLSGTQIMEQKSVDAPVSLTSNNVTVNALRFVLLGENQTDNLQPRITIFSQINGIQLQTTVSQRNFDVQQ